MKPNVRLNIYQTWERLGYRIKQKTFFYVMITKKAAACRQSFFLVIYNRKDVERHSLRGYKRSYKKGQISTKVSLRKTERSQISRLRCKWRCKCWMWVLVLGQNAPVSSISAIQKVRWCQCGGMDLFHDPVNHIVLLIREKYACTKFVFSRMRSEGFPFIVGVWGWTCVRVVLLCRRRLVVVSSSSRRRVVVVSSWVRR